MNFGFTLRKYILQIVIILSLTIQLIWYVLLWRGMVTNPLEPRRADFVIFYVSGQIADRGLYHHLYDLDLQADMRYQLFNYRQTDTSFLPFNHPPLLMPLQQWMATDDIVQSYMRWSVVILGFWIVSLWLISQLMADWPLQTSQKALILVTLSLFYPFYMGLVKGQDSAFLLLGITLLALGIHKKQDLLAGLGLAVISIRPQFVLFLSIPFLFNQRKVFGWFIVFSIVPLISFLALGLAGIRLFIETILVSAKGVGYYMSQSGMFNLIGILFRVFPGLNAQIVQLVGWVAYTSAIAGISFLWARSNPLTLRHIGLAVLVVIVTSPHLHSHDTLPVMIAMLAAMWFLLERRNLPSQKVVLLPFFTSLLLFSGDLLFFFEIFPYARIVSFYIVIIVLALWLWKPDWHNVLLSNVPMMKKHQINES